MKTDSRKRFTLIELLVVIAIIGILASLVFPALHTVRNNARKTKAKTECLALMNAIINYDTEFFCWPANTSGSNDALVTGADYVKMCKILAGENSKKMVFFEAGMSYDENKGFLDPWGRPYQVALDVNGDSKLSENNIPAIKAVNKVNNRSGQDLRSKVFVYSFGVYEDDKIANDITKLAEKKKLVISQ